MAVLDSKYDRIVNWILEKHSEGESIETIEGWYDDDDLFKYGVKYEHWPEDAKMNWDSIISEAKVKMAARDGIMESVKRGMIVNKGVQNKLEVPTDKRSCWQVYRQKLIDREFSNVDTIETECISILRNMRLDTPPDNPVKGMVVGYVQSGKTASMAGLMSMAADCGWNMFIILSGTIDSLRKQTQDRLFKDLDGGDKCDATWIKMEHLNKNDRTSSVFNKRAKHLNICLKNPKRLKDLLEWINHDADRKSNLRVMLIDDEADQASVNTARQVSDDTMVQKRNRINKLIMEIVNCLDKDDQVFGRYGCMNYVSYTATPYANFLSEGAVESLYPKDFISLLTPSKEYFGPYVMFGHRNNGKDYSGMNVFNRYEDTDEIAKAFKNNNMTSLSEGMKDATAWFITSVCVMRLQGYKKPISMLVNITQMTEPHKDLASMIQDYLTEDINEILSRCEKVYSTQTAMLSKSRFFDEYPDYGRSPEVINDYPAYSEISQMVREFVSIRPTHIKIDDEGNIKYSRGIHICIDNSRSDTLDDDSDDVERSVPRLLYPDPDRGDVPDFATAFIVVGGNTLSRGLTIQGLVSTYFGRTTKQADTLMQMGRWFGFRKGYELMPRLWMSDDNIRSFNDMIMLEEDLREYIHDNYEYQSPSDFAPRVRTFPGTSRLKGATASNKMQGAKGLYNYNGTKQEMRKFLTTTESLEKNLEAVSVFLNSLEKTPRKSEIDASLCFDDVSSHLVSNLLDSMDFYDEKDSDELGSLRSFVKDHTADHDWNVVLASIGEGSSQWEPIPGFIINKVERSVDEEFEDHVVIGTMSNPRDRYADVRESMFHGDGYKFENLKGKNYDVIKIREDCGVLDTPLLIIYRISKDSKPKAGVDRKGLNLPYDLIGLSIQFPGEKVANPKEYVQIPESSLS